MINCNGAPIGVLPLGKQRCESRARAPTLGALGPKWLGAHGGLFTHRRRPFRGGAGANPGSSGVPPDQVASSLRRAAMRQQRRDRRHPMGHQRRLLLLGSPRSAVIKAPGVAPSNNADWLICLVDLYAAS